MDREILLALSGLVSVIVGVLCGVLAGYYYVRFERTKSEGVLLAILAMPVQCALVVALPHVRYEALLPSVFVFLIVVASLVMVWVGLKAHSKAGSRIALAGFFTAYAYILFLSLDYYGFLSGELLRFIVSFGR